VSRLILVTGGDCHFCDRAREVFAALGVAVREIGIDTDEARELAATGIPLAFLPVLTDGHRVIAYGRLSEKRLRKELALLPVEGPGP
jgi:glutaredoxin